MDLRDREACYRALQTRDTRFDGRLFIGVTSTGVYCRPVCPARTPGLERCRFFASAAAAHEAGFRPCLRCRPETAPDVGAWRGTSNTVSRALALIEDGALDGGGGAGEALADRLGVGSRQLRRLFERHLGATPVAVAQTRRVLFAKRLIQDTPMPMADVALAAGFGSVRRFNETFRALYERSPSELRRGARHRRRPPAAGAGVTLRLRYRPPYDWDAVLAHLAARAIDPVEQVSGGAYRRVVVFDGHVGHVQIVHAPERHSLAVTIDFPCVRALPTIVARVGRVFDLAADVEAIGRHLSRDPALAPLVAARPGLRVPGAWDGFELAARAVLGQDVTVAAGRRLGARLVEICGGPAFPSAERVAAAALEGLGVPRARREALRDLARAAAADPALLRPSGDPGAAVTRLRAIHGIGDWTAQYIALRALRETDAFPASDAGLLRAAAARGVRPTPAALVERAERWRPWRAYAAQHLWTADAAGQRVRQTEQPTAKRRRKPGRGCRRAALAKREERHA